MQQGNYPLNGRTLAGTDTVTGVVTAATADIPISVLVAEIQALIGTVSPLTIAQGGTGQTTPGGALSALLAGSVIPLANGGTGGTDAPSARTSLGAAASGQNNDITSLAGLTTALSVNQGGTGAVGAVGARTNLGAAASGSNSDITALSGLTTNITVAQGGTGSSNALGARTNLGAAASGVNNDITSLNAPALGAATATTPATGVRSTLVATMQKFADEFPASFGSNGWAQLSNGLIIQWGSATGSASADVAVTFPKAFASSVYSVTGNVVSGVVGYTFAPNTLTTTGFNFGTWSASSTRASGPVYWVAIGK